MASLVAAVQRRFTDVARANPQLAGKTVQLLQGTSFENGAWATLPGWRTEFLTDMGLVVPDTPLAHADRAQPVPLFGSYDTFLDHSRQTFNGAPDFSDPSTQAAGFTTTCAASGCVAHWLRLTELTENPNAPALFDYQWVNDRWESSSEYPFHCDDGSTVTTTRSDFIVPNDDGSFWGERTFTVAGAGCPDDGPVTYWLPFTLTPT